MKKENQQETMQKEQETMQKDTKNNMHFATQWATDVSEIVSDTLKKQVDLSFERMHAVTRANLDFWTGIMNSFNKPFRNSGQKNSFRPNPGHEQDGREQEEKPEKEQSKEFHRR
jgi:hypothetical protein